MSVENPQTIGEFIIEHQKNFKYATGELVRLLSAIKLAAKVVNQKVNKAGLANVLGEVGSVNIQGESQQKLDVLANQVFLKALTSRGVVCGIASEEEEEFISIKNTNENKETSKYVVLIDPLDGSSNIDVNASIGTIFSIYRRVTPQDQPVSLEDFLQPGIRQVAAGYVVYGSSTMLVYTTGNGVFGFTLDPSVGTFYLSHPDVKIPEKGKIYSINEGNYPHFSDEIKNYLQHCKKQENDRPYTARYIGALVADFHRNLIKGGIYMYPATQKSKNGKLRLLYECNPMAFLVEQAGGLAIDGNRRILEIEPKTLHQRVPFFCGSKQMVEEMLTFF